MVEELKLIAEIFKNATDGALYAYLGYLSYSLLKVAIVVFPILSGVKFIVNKVVVDETSQIK